MLLLMMAALILACVFLIIILIVVCDEWNSSTMIPNASNAPHYASKWMQDFSSAPLNQLAMPGTHNSATYAIKWNSKVASDAEKGIVRSPILRPFVKKWSKCQRYSILHQLEGGIRYLDVRAELTKDKEIWLTHALRSITFEGLAEQVRTFLYENSTELVIIDVNHVYAPDGVSLCSAHHEFILKEMIERLGGAQHIAMPSDDGLKPSSPLHEFIARGKRIVLVYDDVKVATQLDVWTSRHIFSKWANHNSSHEVHGVAVQSLMCRDVNDTQLHVSQLVATPSQHDVIRGVWAPFTASPSNLIDFAATLTEEIAPEFVRDMRSHNLNIVLIDSFDPSNTRVIDAMLQHNRCRFHSGGSGAH